MNSLLKQIAVYEPTELDEAPMWSAVFLAVGDYYVEVRVEPTHSVVYQSDHVNTIHNRLSCLSGEMLLESSFQNEQEAKQYFWSFIRDPDMGFMEATI